MDESSDKKRRDSIEGDLWGSFVLMNDTLEEEFDHFRKHILDLDLYAVEAGLCCGADIYSIKYDVVVMRQHLLTCLESGRMTEFPSSGRENSRTCIVSNKMIKVRCYCRLPDSGVMIQCSSCKEWFHKKCDSSIYSERPGLTSNADGTVKAASL